MATYELTQDNMSPLELKRLVNQLPIANRWTLLKILVDSLQPNIQLALVGETNDHPLAKFYGCIDDETFIRHPQPQQSEREPIE